MAAIDYGTKWSGRPLPGKGGSVHLGLPGVDTLQEGRKQKKRTAPDALRESMCRRRGRRMRFCEKRAIAEIS